jgi:DNA modification methylase
LRDYGLPLTVWGGDDPGCAHEFDIEAITGEFRLGQGMAALGERYAGGGHKIGTVPKLNAERGVCRRCGAWRGALGLEPTPEAYVAHLVEVFRAVRRVLRDDGTCWINLGDSFAGSWGNQGRTETRGTQRPINGPTFQPVHDGRYPERAICATPPGLKPKDLVGIPWRVAFALQADGWWLRSEIIWHKPNPMPESVTDRPTKAHESLFLLAKSPRYFYDAEAIREPQSELTIAMYGHRQNGAQERGDGKGLIGRTDFQRQLAQNVQPDLQRNRRSVWTIPSAPFPEAHFATFPPALVEPCVQAGTSERGCCAQCGAPWRRVTSIHYTDAHRGMVGNQRKVITDGRVMHSGREEDQRLDKQVTTLGWAPTCACEAGAPIPAVCLDPFGGAGTVALVADRLGRDAILIELKPEYAAMAERRIREEAPLLTAVAVEGMPTDWEPEPPVHVLKALTSPRGDGSRMTCEGFSRPDGQPWASRARAAGGGNGDSGAAPEQLGLDWSEIARVDV